MKPLPRSFYTRGPLKVAPDLLGKVLCHETHGVLTSGRIVEVEAYLGKEDEASHAYRGMTARNKVMFRPGGYAYVYFTYGSHYCVNVVTGSEGIASAVLIRALEPLEGIEAMKERRKRNKEKELMSGPGKLTQALGIDKKCNGLDLTKKGLWICEGDRVGRFEWVRTTRIGILHATHLPYRFLIKGSEFVSKQ